MGFKPGAGNLGSNLQVAGNISTKKSYPDITFNSLSASEEGRLIWADAGDAGYGAIKMIPQDNKSMRFFTSGITASDEKMRITSAGNVGIGTTTFDGSAAGVLTIKNGTSPAALTADQIYIGSKDSAGTGTDGLATLELFTEEAIDATALDAVGTLSHRIAIWVNGVCYWLYLDPV
tara:strand:+ start:226 stop:753 length:528 start_codon:yes stop_codon:yes gene_type:complete